MDEREEGYFQAKREIIELIDSRIDKLQHENSKYNDNINRLSKDNNSFTKMINKYEFNSEPFVENAMLVYKFTIENNNKEIDILEKTRSAIKNIVLYKRADDET